MPVIDRLSIGVPYQDKTNIGRYSKSDLKCGGNLWPIKYKTIVKSEQKLHNDRFPIELPIKCIKLSGIKDNSIILEPFAGSGTTCLAAKTLNRQYIGIELNPEYCKLANQRLSQ
jgi:site-specific DNA-methyltransferase (adenine-specific)